jgi:hypothetical protein
MLQFAKRAVGASLRTLSSAPVLASTRALAAQVEAMVLVRRAGAPLASIALLEAPLRWSLELRTLEQIDSQAAPELEGQAR